MNKDITLIYNNKYEINIYTYDTMNWGKDRFIFRIIDKIEYDGIHAIEFSGYILEELTVNDRFIIYLDCILFQYDLNKWYLIHEDNVEKDEIHILKSLEDLIKDIIYKLILDEDCKDLIFRLVESFYSKVFENIVEVVNRVKNQIKENKLLGYKNEMKGILKEVFNYDYIRYGRSKT